MAPAYKLTYFNVRARAELTRLIFSYAGVDFEDVRVSGDWSEVKASKKWFSISLDPWFVC